jgi:hypothetical protein
MADGVVVERHEGTPQGGPLSPLLANVLLDEVDKELERRGHRFVRYADDCNIYVRSKRAGNRALAVLRTKYAKLRLRNQRGEERGGVGVGPEVSGYSFWVAPGRTIKRRVAPKALEELSRTSGLSHAGTGDGAWNESVANSGRIYAAGRSFSSWRITRCVS